VPRQFRAITGSQGAARDGGAGWNDALVRGVLAKTQEAIREKARSRDVGEEVGEAAPARVAPPHGALIYPNLPLIWPNVPNYAARVQGESSP
jgi:hypothetical protein